MNNSDANISYVNLLYASDNIRRDHIKNAIESEPDLDVEIDECSLLDTWNGPDDLTVAVNRGNHILYKEGWVQSCWQALFEKVEYKGLSKNCAIGKFMHERMSKIALSLNLNVTSYEFKHNILTVNLNKS